MAPDRLSILSFHLVGVFDAYFICIYTKLLLRIIVRQGLFSFKPQLDKTDILIVILELAWLRNPFCRGKKTHNTSLLKQKKIKNLYIFLMFYLITYQSLMC